MISLETSVILIQFYLGILNHLLIYGMEKMITLQLNLGLRHVYNKHLDFRVTEQVSTFFFCSQNIDNIHRLWATFWITLLWCFLKCWAMFCLLYSNTFYVRFWSGQFETDSTICMIRRSSHAI